MDRIGVGDDRLGLMGKRENKSRMSGYEDVVKSSKRKRIRSKKKRE